VKILTFISGNVSIGSVSDYHGSSNGSIYGLPFTVLDFIYYTANYSILYFFTRTNHLRIMQPSKTTSLKPSSKSLNLLRLFKRSSNGEPKKGCCCKRDYSDPKYFLDPLSTSRYILTAAACTLTGVVSRLYMTFANHTTVKSVMMGDSIRLLEEMSL
jgi:hypothetical protein